jgi:hypothetical protein
MGTHRGSIVTLPYRDGVTAGVDCDLVIRSVLAARGEDLERAQAACRRAIASMDPLAPPSACALGSVVVTAPGKDSVPRSVDRSMGRLRVPGVGTRGERLDRAENVRGGTGAGTDDPTVVPDATRAKLPPDEHGVSVSIDGYIWISRILSARKTADRAKDACRRAGAALGEKSKIALPGPGEHRVPIGVESYLGKGVSVPIGKVLYCAQCASRRAGTGL